MSMAHEPNMFFSSGAMFFPSPFAITSCTRRPDNRTRLSCSNGKPFNTVTWPQVSCSYVTLKHSSTERDRQGMGSTDQGEVALARKRERERERQSACESQGEN